MEYTALVEAYLRLLDRRQLVRLDAELWKFNEALDLLLHELLTHPRPDWREQLDAFLAEQDAEGRIATPESRQSLVDYLEWWAATVGIDASDPDPGTSSAQLEVISVGQPSVGSTLHESESGHPLGALDPLWEEQIRTESMGPSFVPQPPVPDWQPRIVEIKQLKGFWDDYRALVTSGQYEQGWWEWISVGFTSTILPSSEPGTRITFDDGTVLFILGGGPDSGALAGQGTFLLGAHGAAARAIKGAPTLWQAVATAFKQFGRETAENIADSVVQEVTGLPVGPSALRRPKAGGKGKPGTIEPRESGVKPKIRRNPLHDIIEGKAQKTSTKGHAFRSYREAIKMARSGRYDKIWLNQSYSTATGSTTTPPRRPDVIGRRKTGEFDAIEVPSRTDSETALRLRNEEAMNQLPKHQRGRVRIVRIKRSKNE